MFKKKMIFRHLGLKSYIFILNKMHYFTNYRNNLTNDEIWFLQHPKIFTKGQSEFKKNIKIFNNIPIVQSDRGGKITYHSPGQQIIYFLINLKRRKLIFYKFINILENIIINTLFYFNINSHTCLNSHGVYIGFKKICSIGLRIKNNCSLHGLSLNICMDLNPFNKINPCGFKKLKMIQINNFYPKIKINYVKKILLKEICNILKIEYCEHYHSFKNFIIKN